MTPAARWWENWARMSAQAPRSKRGEAVVGGFEEGEVRASKGELELSC